MHRLNFLKRWEGILLVLLIVVVAYNSLAQPEFLTVGNWVNLFQLSIEKIIVAVVMTFIIVNAEIDLSVASMMGLSACTFGFLWHSGVPAPVCILAAMLVGVLGGVFNGFWVARVGLPSLVVTLSMLIGFRGLARVLLENNSYGDFPEWMDRLGQQPLVGPFTLSMILFFVVMAAGIVILHYSGFGRFVYVIGNSSDVARYAGVKVRRVKWSLFIASCTMAALAGLLYAARLGAVRGDIAVGFELDIITMVLLGGVSIFGGSGSLWGVLLSILIILSVRNGMGLANLSGHVQTGVVGSLLILSVLVPNLIEATRTYSQRRRIQREATAIEA